MRVLPVGACGRVHPYLPAVLRVKGRAVAPRSPERALVETATSVFALEADEVCERLVMLQGSHECQGHPCGFIRIWIRPRPSAPRLSGSSHAVPAASSLADGAPLVLEKICILRAAPRPNGAGAAYHSGGVRASVGCSRSVSRPSLPSLHPRVRHRCPSASQQPRTGWLARRAPAGRQPG
jgi:hypothetical protein